MRIHSSNYLFLPWNDSSASIPPNDDTVHRNTTKPTAHHTQAPLKPRIVTSRRSKSKAPRAQHNDDDEVEVVERDAITDADARQKRPKKEDGGNARRELVSSHTYYNAPWSDYEEGCRCR